MKSSKNQLLKSNYVSLFYHHVQYLVYKRKSLRLSQSRMAYEAQVSLRTVQNFENYKCHDAYLIYAYKQIFKEHS